MSEVPLYGRYWAFPKEILNDKLCEAARLGDMQVRLSQSVGFISHSAFFVSLRPPTVDRAPPPLPLSAHGPSKESCARLRASVTCRFVERKSLGFGV